MNKNMKKLLSLIFGLFLGFNATAQIAPLPLFIPALTNIGGSGAGLILGGFTNQFNLAANAGQTNLLLGVAITNCSPTRFRVLPLEGVAFTAAIGVTNALSGSNIIFNFNVSIDGTNWSQNNPIVATFPLGSNILTGGAAAGGAAALWLFTNFPPNALNNAQFIRLDNIQHIHTNTVFLSNTFFGTFR